MRRLTLAFTAALFACNTAELSEPPVQDSGTGACPADVVPQCDAGAPAVGCVADPDAGGLAARNLTPGVKVPVDCKVITHQLTTNGDCEVSECTCVGDGGAASWVCVK